MSFPEIRNLDWPVDAAGTALVVGAGAQHDVRQLTDKGYDYTRGALSTHTSNLEGSVSGENWTVIAALGASAQGAIPDHYNYVRIDCTGAGVYDSDVLRAAGKTA